MWIWIVIAWDNYYPSPDNTVGFYRNEEDAKSKYKEVLESNRYDGCDYYRVEVE